MCSLRDTYRFEVMSRIDEVESVGILGRCLGFVSLGYPASDHED
jgi:hypothetical protein